MKRSFIYCLFTVAALASIGCGDSTTGSTSGGGESGDVSTESDTGSHSDSTGNGLECGNNGGCEDNDPCTLESCEDGFCAYYDSAVPGCDSEFEAAVCKEDADCDKFLEDQGSCVTALCDPDTKECRIESPEDGTLCDDGDICTGGDRCEAGDCVAGEDDPCDDGDSCTEDACDPVSGCASAPLVCADDNPCTDDSCLAESGCQFTPLEDGSPCDDGDACTQGEACAEGACTGVNDCDDENPCTEDTCDADGGCLNTPAEGATCDDGDACTGQDLCDADAFCSGEALNCDDENVCTLDTCDPELGCVYVASLEGCDDGDPCNGVETCDGNNACIAGPAPECGDGTTNGACGEECDDGGTLDGDGCSAECLAEEVACTLDTDCEDSNACSDNVCEGGLCAYPFNTLACDDGDACSSGDACNLGACLGSPLSCDDGVECTEDTCDSASGCAYALQDALCDDGKVCTSDACIEGTGCIYAPETDLPCDDGDSCTEGDACGITQGGSSFCAGEQIPGCVELNPICELTGIAGETVSCFLKLVKQSESSEGVAALQFDMLYTTSEISLENVYAEKCPNPADPTQCFQVAMMPGGSLDTGHTVSSAPSDPTECDGDVTFILSSLSSLSYVSDAFFSDTGEIVGDEVFLEAKFILAIDATEGNPVVVNIGELIGSSLGAESLQMSIVNMTMISGDE